ncbi:hypothetical protein ACFLX5_02565 [Chloroflexota bacterium]
MLKLKGCPRCEGDLFLEEDFDGWYEECLQCGYLHDLEDMEEFLERLTLGGDEQSGEICSAGCKDAGSAVAVR